MTTVSDEFPERIDAWIHAHRQEYATELTGLIHIKSVADQAIAGYPFGKGTADALDYVLALSKKYGFITENDDYYCGSAILVGQTKAPGVALVGHLDVVPEGEGWDFPPYEAKIIQGQITGRGSSDNKGPSLAALFALRCVKELGVPLQHSFRVLFGCQEECGMNDMPYFLEKHREGLPQLFLICDSFFPIHYGEKGILSFDLETKLTGTHITEMRGGVADNSVSGQACALLQNVSFDSIVKQAASGDACEDICVTQEKDAVKICAGGIAGHAAFPEGSKNAIGVLAHALSSLKELDPLERKAMDFLWRTLEKYDGSFLGIASEDALWGRTTAIGGHVNLQDNRLTQNMNIRYGLPIKYETMLEQLEKSASEYGFSVKNINNSLPMYVPLNSMGGLPRKISTLAEELLNMGPLEPEILAGGTHARVLPNAIGFGPDMDTDPPCLGHAHGPNETVRLDIMERAIRIYAASIPAIDRMLSEQGR